MHFMFWSKNGGENGTFCLTCFRNFVIVLLINLFQTENFAFGVHIDGSLILRSFTTTGFKNDEK